MANGEWRMANNPLAGRAISTYLCAVNDFDQRSGVGVGGTAFATAFRLPAKRPAAKAGYTAVGATESGNVLSAAIGSLALTPFLRAYPHDASSNREETVNGLPGALPAAPVKYEANIDDGRNRIADHTGDALARTYTWGLDLSGTMQDASGVGGLLAVRLLSSVSESSVFYPTYDGNGNISEYLDDEGEVVAHFEYDPFGNLTVDSEENAQDFPYRFSTKPQDSVTGLLYYAYRWYDPLTGRWPSRDPIGERGGVNLYGFCFNSAFGWLDFLGLDPWPVDVTLIPNIRTTRDVPNPPIKPDATEDSIDKNYKKMKERGTIPDEVFPVSDLVDANTNLRKLSQNNCCVKQLTLEGHGSPGLQNVGPMNNGRGTIKTILGVYRETTGKYKPLGFDFFRGVKFCKPCKIILRGCNQAAGANGRLEVTPVQEFALLLRNATGCSVEGWPDSCKSWDDRGERSRPPGTNPPIVISPGFEATDDGRWNTVPRSLEDTIKEQRVIQVEAQQ